MSKHLYWRFWPQPYRLLFWVLLSLFFALIISILVLQFIGNETLLGWSVLTKDSSFVIDYSIFSEGPFNFSILGDKKILTELFAGGSMPSTAMASNILVLIVFGCMLLYAAVSTMFTRLWYLIAMGGLLTFLILFHVESLGLFGWNDTRVLIIVFVFILTPSYYLHAFKSKSSFLYRLGVLALALMILGVLIYFFGNSQQPFLNLLTYGMLAPYLLVIFFIFSVAHEVIAAFVNVISSTENIDNSVKIRHFLIITGIYLANILLSFLYKAHYIDWQLFYINPFFLLMISAVLGIWGSRIRSSLYDGATKQAWLWPIMYLILGIVSLATLASFMVAMNDPFLKVLGDLIIYTHLAIGVAFVLYILYNFTNFIEEGLALSKVLYKPTNLPYFTYRLMGIIMVVALFAVRGFDYPVWYSMGGFNNTKADMVLNDGFLNIAKAYYQNGDSYAYHNHKSNYALGMIYANKEPALAIDFFDKAKDQQPTSQAIINKANLQDLEQDVYSALFSLQEGNAILPQNYHIYNNLAWQFEKVKVIDSAYLYLQLADAGDDAVKTNRLGFTAKYNKPLGKDSINLFSNLSRASRANASAHGYFKERPDLLTADHMYDMVLFNNWLLSTKSWVDKKSLSWAKGVIDITKNQEYQQQLLYSWSLANYRAGKMTLAIEGLLKLSYNSEGLEKRAKMALGKIYLDLGAYEKAITMFEELGEGKFSLELATSMMENGTYEKALSFWQQASMAEDKFLATTANEIRDAVYADEPVLDTDKKRYLYGRYKRFFIDQADESELLNKIETNDLRIGLALDLADFYHQYGNTDGANLMLKNIEGFELKKDQYRRYIILNGLINQGSENVQNQLIEFDKNYSFQPEEYLLENTLNHLAGMTLDSTDYLNMAQDNPFFPDAVLIGANYFSNDKDYFRSYSFLAKAVQINPDSPKLMEAFILKALEVGLDQTAENSLYEFSQKFSGQSYIVLRYKYDRLKKKISDLVDAELLE